MATHRYSDYFHTIHDETSPVGHLGRGTHYSVLRYASWHDVERRQLDRPVTHDFAVIWDEDHDTRVISVIERIFQAGLLAPIQFIGERKAHLSIVVAARFRFACGDDQVWERYTKQLEEIAADVDGDYWNIEVGYYDRAGPHHQTHLPAIINCPDSAIDIYLRNIDNLWNLGTWSFERSYRMRPELPPPADLCPPLPPRA